MTTGTASLLKMNAIRVVFFFLTSLAIRVLTDLNLYTYSI